jgi:hypothetical protein
MPLKAGKIMTSGTTTTMTMTTESEKSGSASHLKNIFDQSLAVLCDGNGKSNGKSSVPSHRSSLPLHLDAVNLQKLALTNAANALAALWKVSDRKPAKLQSRALQYNSR